MRAIVVGVFVALVGCDEVFHLSGRTDDGPVDAARIDGDTLTDGPGDLACEGNTTLLFEEKFEGFEPCAPWGFKFQDNLDIGIEQSGGALRIAPTAIGGGGCISNSTPMFPSTMIVEVSEVIDPQAGFTYMAAGGGSDTIKVRANGLFYETDDGVTTYDSMPWIPEQARFWRLEQVDITRIASVSADGVTWKELGRRTFPRGVGTIELIGGLGGNSGNPRRAVFEHMIVCQ